MIAYVPGLPKTRSGKIMCRTLRAIAKGEPITQDTSTLEEPSTVEKIQEVVNGLPALIPPAASAADLLPHSVNRDTSGK